MTGVLNSLFRAISPLWEMSLTAAYAAVVVALLRLVLKKRAPRQVLCLLWLVVFARLLIPVPLESPVSIVPDARQVQQLTGQAPVLPEKGGEQTVSHQPAVQNPAQGQTPGGVTADPVSQGGAGTGPVLTAPGGTAPFAPQPELPAPFPWQAVVAGVWLAGVLAMGGYGLVSYLRLRRRLYDAIRAQDGAWEHPAVTSPFILGVLWPRIYLPAGLQGQPRQFILCHERAHLRRCDHIVKPVCWAALALHWFNPMVWAAFLLMSRDIEAACDEAVIRRLGPGVKADYSATLLSLATNGRVPAPCPLAFDEGDAKGRIKNVLRYRRPALWIVVVSVVLAAVAAVCLLTDPVAAEKPDADPSADPSPDASQSQAPEGDAIADPWMLEVLDGKGTFFLRGAGDITVDRLSEAFYGALQGRTMAVSKVAVIDLDKDGVKEMVLWPSINGDDSIETMSVPGYIILRRRGDDILAFDPGFRSFAYLKEDGTFSWSQSAFEGGIAAARFAEDLYFHLENVSWCETNGQEESYFVDGIQADYDAYQDAIYAQNHKPEVTWYVYEGGQLWPAPPDAPFRPDSLISNPGPRDLTREELDYFQDYFWVGEGGRVPNIRTMLLVSEYSDPRDIDLYSTFYHGFHYVPDFTQKERDALDLNGIHEEVKVTAAEMDQTLRAYLGLGLEETNKVGLENFRYLPEYDAYYTKHTDFWGDWFTMRSGRIREDGTIALVYEGTNYIPRGLRVAVLKEAEQVYAHRLYYQVVSNVAADDQDPYAAVPQPAASPDPSPEPTPEPSASRAEVTQVGNGYQVSWGGQSFPVDQSITPDLCANVYTADFDGDGREEAAFCLWGSPVWVIDLPDGGAVPVAYVFDPASLRYDLAVNSVAAITPEGGMTFTYSWGALDESTRRYISTHADYPDSFFQGGNEPMKSGKPLTIDTANGGVRAYANDPSPYLDVSVTVVLNVEDGDGVVIAGRVVAFQHYAVRYTGSGFTVDVPGQLDIVSDSPQGSTPSQPASSVLP